MKLDECALEFIKKFPEYKLAYHDHIDNYGELLGHVFFGDILNVTLSELLKKNEDILKRIYHEILLV